MGCRRVPGAHTWQDRLTSSVGANLLGAESPLPPTSAFSHTVPVLSPLPASHRVLVRNGGQRGARPGREPDLLTRRPRPVRFAPSPQVPQTFLPGPTYPLRHSGSDSPGLTV